MRKVLVFTLFLLLFAGTASATWLPWYTQDAGRRIRGLAVYAEDDFAVGPNSSTTGFAAEWYHNAWQCKGCYDCTDATYNCPIAGHEAEPPIAFTWRWGIGLEYGTDLVYHANQDDSTSVLVYDHDCNEVNRLELGIQHASSEYPTACDLDADGNVYVAWYIDGATRSQIEVYSPRATWVNHKGTLLTGMDAGAYVTEGMCVNAAGTVVYQTNRSAPGSYGWVARFTGTVAGGFVQDMAFAGDGTADCEGYVRAVDLDEAGNRIFVCQDGSTPDGRVYIFNATTGALQDSIICNQADVWSTSPYDVEFLPPNQLYINHYYGWYVDKWIEGGPWAVTMTSFEATAGEEMVELTWTVQSEVENQGFHIYRDNQMIAAVPSQGATETERTYTWIDRDVVPGITYVYKIADVNLDGVESPHDFVATATPLTSSGMPNEYWLSQNYPNPFNADTQIEFKLAEPGHTSLKIYNTMGQLVRTLVDRDMAASHHKVLWDGRNNSGQMVSSGIYFYRLASGKFAETKKMSFLR